MPTFLGHTVSYVKLLSKQIFFIGRRHLGHTVCYFNNLMFRVQFNCNGCKQTGFPLSCYESVEVTDPDKEELDVIIVIIVFKYMLVLI